MTTSTTSHPAGRRAGRRLATAALLVALAAAMPLAARAQQPAPAAPTKPLPACVGCANQPNAGAAVGELFVSEMLPYGYNRWVDHVAWSHTTLHSWSYNLRRGWGWDTDHFSVNQLAHPYSGGMFFNSARSNGYPFWTSAPFALVGSVVWEYFGETTRPSINDLANTTLGGITLGETSYRLAHLILDRRTTGATRIGRELGAALVSPQLAIARLVHGDVGRVGPNPVDRVPSRVASELAVGYQRVNRGGVKASLNAADQAIVRYSLDYGDPLRGDVTHPFGAFRLDGTFATSSAPALSQLQAVGFLGTRDVGIKDTLGVRARQVQLAMDYEYFNNRAFVTGAQGISGIFIARHPLAPRLALRTELGLTGYPISGVQSDFRPDPAAVANETARTYDYGAGGGGRVLARLERGGRPMLEGAYQAAWVKVLSGAATSQAYRIASVRGQLPPFHGLSLGASALLYSRVGNYSTHATVHSRDGQSQLFVVANF